MSFKYKEVYAASAEVLGMILAYMEEKEDVSWCQWFGFVIYCTLHEIAMLCWEVGWSTYWTIGW